jgi:N-acetylmuramoyl-L-alanine amidase
MAGFEVTLTRRTDVFVPLAARVERARRAGADLLLSVHADIVEQGEASGASVYTLSETASDALAAELADNANASDRFAGAAMASAGEDVARALIALVHRDTVAQAERFAASLVDELGARIPMLATRPHRHAGFRVLKGPDIPSALLEIGFLSNAADRARLGDPEWREAALEGVVEGVRRWADRRAATAQAGN